MKNREKEVFFAAMAVLLCTSILISLCFSFSAAVTDQQDMSALIALHTAWSSNPSSWDTSTDPCETPWLGIMCDNGTRVLRLLLINQNLKGILPPAIGNLSSLTDLALSNNPKLGGTLPKEIGKLTNLQTMLLQFCGFSGSIPSEIGNMTSMNFLSLSENALTGSIPASVGLLQKMTYFDISSNFLSENLPDSVSSGLGFGLDNLTNVKHFHFQNNSFSGSIPSAIFNPRMQLKHVLLNNNSFSGKIPSSIGDLSYVELMRLDFNDLNGSIPSTISNIQNLTTLQLNNNALSGQLPDLTNNTKLQMLDLSNNHFDTSEVPGWITSLTNLLSLSMISSNLIGNIPTEIFKFSNISNVTLGSNNLNGTLNLTTSSASLLLVDVTNNNISSLDKGTYTHELLLDGNPYCSNNPNNCTFVESSASPTLPPGPSTTSDCTANCSVANYAINPKYGNCQCSHPVVGNIMFAVTKVPILTNVVSLMEQQILAGIRDFMKNLTIFENQVVLDVMSAVQVKVLVFPPNGTESWQPNDAALISYALNNQEILFLPIGPFTTGFFGAPYDKVVVVVNNLSTPAKIGIGIGVAVFVIAIMVSGVYAMKMKKRAQKAEKLNKPFAAWIEAGEGETVDIPQLKGARWFSFEEIRKCTDNFSQINVIGEGGYGKVYKGFLFSGESVAIKRARTESLQGANEFKNEIELLSRVHHINLVGLIGFCFEQGEQMLVYEYMPNGTLRECLSGTIGIQMDWATRIALVLDSARGIAYLHTEANPPIIHRDIKSSNILLDDKLVAKVADFGLSHLAPTKDAEAPLSLQVKGTMGYLDPDYFMTNRFTDKSDVYSFGVVLVEVVTARPAIQSGKYVVHALRTTLEQGGMDLVIKSMVDPDLREYPPKALQRLVELALSCLQDNPDARPTMLEVVKEIEHLSEVASTNMDVNLEGKNEQSYGENLPFMQQNLGTSFNYSASYVEINTNVEPK